MSTENAFYPPQLGPYLQQISRPLPPILEEIRTETQKLAAAKMSISADQGRFLNFLIAALAVQNAIELGTFTGYSATAMALALPDNGQLLCCEVNAEYAAIAEKFWIKAGLSSRINVAIGSASDTLDRLLANHKQVPFDFAFIDADKANYRNYYEKLLLLLRPGGVMVFDNVLWSGQVWQESCADESTQAIRQLNQTVFKDDRVTACLVPIGDGMMMIHKR